MGTFNELAIVTQADCKSKLTESVEEFGVYSPPERDSLGRILPGTVLNPRGRKKGSKDKMTSRMVERYAYEIENGTDPEQILFEIMRDSKTDPALRAKVALDLLKLVPASVQEVKVEGVVDNSMEITFTSDDEDDK
jgi:hypothetical protein